jgi:endo-1,4-beta-xylanase
MNMLGTGSSSEGHLRDHAKQKYIGVGFESDAFSDQKYMEILGQEFNCITPGNDMKWGPLEAVRGE